jgi:hypothetical protein
MFARKKTVHESAQMVSEIPLEDVRAEIRRLALKEQSRLSAAQREQVFWHRMEECERLNELIKQENPSLTASAFEKPTNDTRENPFFQALKQQKDLRDKYKNMLTLALENGPPSESLGQDSSQLAQLKDGAPAVPDDIFKYTVVDVPEAEQ